MIDIDYIDSQLASGEVELADSNGREAVIYFERLHPYLPKRRHETILVVGEFPTTEAVLDELATYHYVAFTPNGAYNVERLRAAAMGIVQASGEPVAILPLAQQLAERTGCTVKTAKLRIAEAVRRMSSLDWQPPERGGTRPGAGRPRDREES